MEIIFWGVRGGIPSNGKEYSKFGTQTACVALRLNNHSPVIIFDAGTGFAFFGLNLINKTPLEIILFLSHFHIDHIYGLPFVIDFPIFKNNNIQICAVPPKKATLRDTLLPAITSPIYPIAPTNFPKHVVFKELNHHTDYRISNCNDCMVRTYPIKHMEGSTAYRLKADGRTLVYATDLIDTVAEDNGFIDFCAKADVLIHDATFAPEDINDITRFWHSSYETAVLTGLRAKAKKLILFHHGFSKNDRQLIINEKRAKKLAKGKIVVISARERMRLKI